MLAQQGKWKTLFELSMKIAIPTYDPDPDDELLDAHGLSKQWHVNCTLLPVKDRLAKLGPAKLTQEVWQEAKTKLKPHNDSAPPAVDATKSWHPTVEQCATFMHELKPNKLLT